MWISRLHPIFQREWWTTNRHPHTVVWDVWWGLYTDIKNVRKWCREFSQGRTEVHDKKSNGRPSSISDKIVAKVEDVIRQYRLLIVGELALLILNISKTSIREISKERWVPKMLMNHKRQCIFRALCSGRSTFIELYCCMW